MRRHVDPAATSAMVVALRRGVVSDSKLPRARLAAGHTVRIGLLTFRGLWTGAAAEEIEAIKVRLPSVSWVRLGGPGAPWTREVLNACSTVGATR